MFRTVPFSHLWRVPGPHAREAGRTGRCLLHGRSRSVLWWFRRATGHPFDGPSLPVDTLETVTDHAASPAAAAEDPYHAAVVDLLGALAYG
ncbi:MAG: hypothetical protein ACRDV2_08005, partial [Actinomycetes bacterium]